MNSAGSLSTPRIRLPSLFWLTLAAITFAGVAVCLSIWIPHLQRGRAIAEIKRRGGIVTAQPDPAAPWVSWLTGDGGMIVDVDFSSVELEDDDLTLLSELQGLRQLSLSGPALTDDGLQQLASLQEMENLVLINCPGISERGEQKLKGEIPALQISRRGAALLGIIGRGFRFGCRVFGVRLDTAAARAGIRSGDVIVRFDGHRVRTFESLTRLIAKRQPGDRVTVIVYRGRKPLVLSAVLGAWRKAK